MCFTEMSRCVGYVYKIEHLELGSLLSSRSLLFFFWYCSNAALAEIHCYLCHPLDRFWWCKLYRFASWKRTLWGPGPSCLFNASSVIIERICSIKTFLPLLSCTITSDPRLCTHCPWAGFSGTMICNCLVYITTTQNQLIQGMIPDRFAIQHHLEATKDI